MSKQAIEAGKIVALRHKRNAYEFGRKRAGIGNGGKGGKKRKGGTPGQRKGGK